MRLYPTAVIIVASNFFLACEQAEILKDLVMIRRKLAFISAAATATFFFLATTSQNVAAQTRSGTDVVLVLPFENCGEKAPPQCHVVDRPEYNWIGESFADSLSTLLNKPGLRVATSEERAVAYQRLRLP